MAVFAFGPWRYYPILHTDCGGVVELRMENTSRELIAVCATCGRAFWVYEQAGVDLATRDDECTWETGYEQEEEA